MNIDQENLDKTSFIFINELLQLKRNDNIFVYTDKGGCKAITDSIKRKSDALGTHMEIYELDSNLSLPDKAEQLTKKIEQGAYDVICEFSEQYFYQTSVWKVAKDKGIRVYSLAGIDADSFIRCVGEVDQNVMFQIGEELKKLLLNAKKVEISTKMGTKITMNMKSHCIFDYFPLRRFKAKSYVHSPSGTLENADKQSFMGGAIGFSRRSTFHGRNGSRRWLLLASE